MSLVANVYIMYILDGTTLDSTINLQEIIESKKTYPLHCGDCVSRWETLLDKGPGLFNKVKRERERKPRLPET